MAFAMFLFLVAFWGEGGGGMLLLLLLLFS